LDSKFSFRNSSSYRGLSIRSWKMRLFVWSAVVLSMKKKVIRLLYVLVVICLYIRSVLISKLFLEMIGFVSYVFGVSLMESM
jgi:hypothetical protein